MRNKNKQQNTVRLVLLGAVLGLLTFLLIYGTAPLDVTNDNWIFYGYDESDIRQDYAGWLAFRSSSWQFPLAQADSFAYPCKAGANICFMDSLPMVAVFFKLFAAWEPATFQWLGWYVLTAYVLQGSAAALLLGLFLPGVLRVAAGTLLFTFSPVMMERSFRHPSLASHYFVVFSLYFYLRGRREGRSFIPAFWILAAAATGITPYFLPMVAVFALLLALDRLCKTGKLREPAVLFLGTCAAGMANAFILGSVGNGYAAGRDGYGFYSMNLNAPFNPKSLGTYTWSQVLHTRLRLYGQYDGFNYLGLGMLVLLGTVAAACVLGALCSRRCRSGLIRTVRRNLPLLIVLVLLTMYAVSNVVCLDDRELLNIALPETVLNLLGIFRASSRLFWPVYYTLMLAGCVGLYRVFARWLNRERLFPLVLAAFTAFQLWDMRGVIAEKHAFMAESAAAAPPAPAEFTDRIGSYDMLAILPDMDYPRAVFALTLKYGLKTNGRETNTPTEAWQVTDEWTQQLADAVDNGELDTNTLYVTRDFGRLARWQELYGDRADFFVWDTSACGVEPDHTEVDVFMLPKQ